MKRLAAKLKPSAEKAVKQGHPWVWENSIDKLSPGGKSGSQVIIFDKKKNKFLAFGLYDPHSPIRIKILQASIPMQLDEAWLIDNLTVALDKRKTLIDFNTNSYRWIYGENDHLPGLIIDVYNRTGVLKIYSTIWLPYLDSIIKAVVEVNPLSTLVLRMGRNTAKEVEPDEIYYDGAVVFGRLDNPEIIFNEYGLKFSANVIEGHKTGYFLDHRHNRHNVSKLSKGKKVLDVFSYAGGFSVHALAGGAKEVTSLDISNQALSLAQKNVKLNMLGKNHKIIVGDAFEIIESLSLKNKKYDLIIVDPPSFAKKIEERERALKSYKRLARQALRLVSKGGMLIMASCSSRISKSDFFDAIESEFLNQNVRFNTELKTDHDIDHPIRIQESAYLKCGYYTIL